MEVDTDMEEVSQMGNMKVEKKVLEECSHWYTSKAQCVHDSHQVVLEVPNKWEGPELVIQVKARIL